MTMFDEREKAFENKYFKDKELEFALRCKQRKFIALWAAEQMHMDDVKSLEYALELVTQGMDENQEAMLQRILGDFQKNGLDISEEELRQKIVELKEVALQKLEKDNA